MKLKTVLKIITVTATAAVLIMIFYLSSQPADESEETSRSFGYTIYSIFWRGFEKLTEEEKLEFASRLDSFIRKSAHFTEFAVLGALYYADFYLFGVKKRKFCLLFAFLSSTASAVFDEVHQMFIPGRAGMVTDGLIDVLGVICGCLVSLLLISVINLIRRKRLKKTG